MRRLGVIALGGILAGVPGALVAALFVGRGRPRRRRPSGGDPVAVASLVLVLVGAGTPVIAALSLVAATDPSLDAVVRRSRRLGIAAALAGASGPLAPLLHRLGDAAISGAPPEPAIRSFLEAERRRRATQAMERARRLPVRLMVPMTLLVLPGFVLAVYGPAFIAMTRDLLGPLAP